MTSHPTTVMGPGQSSYARSTTDPPIYYPDQDNLIWRKNVSSWVELIAAGATKGEDKHYQTIYATLGRQLYDKGLPQAQKSIVDEAQLRGIINYKQEDQIKVIKEI